jgi:integrase
MSQTLLSLAGFQVILIGRFWVIAEGMAKLARDVIRPAFAAVGLQWHGWHAFRRGLATNLHRLGVPDKTIQAILRHANVAVTQGCYIKTVRSDATEAMQLLEAATRKRT